MMDIGAGEPDVTPMVDLNWPCDGCTELRQKLAKSHAEHSSNYATMKQKIISTDLLIKKFKSKCDKYDTQTKLLEETRKQLEKSQRDCQTLQKQMQVALDQLEPLKKANATVTREKSRQAQEMSLLTDKLRAAEQLQNQYKELMLEANQSKQATEEQAEGNKKRLQLLENSSKKQEVTIAKLKDEVNQKRTELTDVKKRNRRLENECSKFSTRLEKYHQILRENGLIPRGERLLRGSVRVTSPPFTSQQVAEQNEDEKSLGLEEETDHALGFVPEILSDEEDEDVSMETEQKQEPIKLSDIFSEVFKLEMLTPLSPLAASNFDSDQESVKNSGEDGSEEEELSKFAGLLESEFTQDDPRGVAETETKGEDVSLGSGDAEVEPGDAVDVQNVLNGPQSFKEDAEADQDCAVSKDVEVHDEADAVFTKDVIIAEDHNEKDKKTASDGSDLIQEPKLPSPKTVDKTSSVPDKTRNLPRRLSQMDVHLPSLLEDEVFENGPSSRELPFPADSGNLFDTDSECLSEEDSQEAAKKVTRQSTTEFVVSKDSEIESLGGNSTDQETTVFRDHSVSPVMSQPHSSTPTKDLNGNTAERKEGFDLKINANSTHIPLCQNESRSQETVDESLEEVRGVLNDLCTAVSKHNKVSSDDNVSVSFGSEQIPEESPENLALPDTLPAEDICSNKDDLPNDNEGEFPSMDQRNFSAKDLKEMSVAFGLSSRRKRARRLSDPVGISVRSLRSHSKSDTPISDEEELYRPYFSKRQEVLSKKLSRSLSSPCEKLIDSSGDNTGPTVPKKSKRKLLLSRTLRRSPRISGNKKLSGSRDNSLQASVSPMGEDLTYSVPLACEDMTQSVPLTCEMDAETKTSNVPAAQLSDGTDNSLQTSVSSIRPGVDLTQTVPLACEDMTQSVPLTFELNAETQTSKVPSQVALDKDQDPKGKETVTNPIPSRRITRALARQNSEGWKSSDEISCDETTSYLHNKLLQAASKESGICGDTTGEDNNLIQTLVSAHEEDNHKVEKGDGQSDVVVKDTCTSKEEYEVSENMTKVVNRIADETENETRVSDVDRSGGCEQKSLASSRESRPRELTSSDEFKGKISEDGGNLHVSKIVEGFKDDQGPSDAESFEVNQCSQPENAKQGEIQTSLNEQERIDCLAVQTVRHLDQSCKNYSSLIQDNENKHSGSDLDNDTSKVMEEPSSHCSKSSSTSSAGQSLKSLVTKSPPQSRPTTLSLATMFTPIYIPSKSAATVSTAPPVIRQSISSIAIVSPQTSCEPVAGTSIAGMGSVSRSVTPSSGCSVTATSPVSPLPPSPFEYLNIIPISPLPPSPAPAEPLSPLPSSPIDLDDQSLDSTLVQEDIQEGDMEDNREHVVCNNREIVQGNNGENVQGNNRENVPGHNRENVQGNNRENLQGNNRENFQVNYREHVLGDNTENSLDNNRNIVLDTNRDYVDSGNVGDVDNVRVDVPDVPGKALNIIKDVSLDSMDRRSPVDDNRDYVQDSIRVDVVEANRENVVVDINRTLPPPGVNNEQTPRKMFHVGDLKPTPLPHVLSPLSVTPSGTSTGLTPVTPSNIKRTVRGSEATPEGSVQETKRMWKARVGHKEGGPSKRNIEQAFMKESPSVDLPAASQKGNTFDGNLENTPVDQLAPSSLSMEDIGCQSVLRGKRRVSHYNSKESEIKKTMTVKQGLGGMPSTTDRIQNSQKSHQSELNVCEFGVPNKQKKVRRPSQGKKSDQGEVTVTVSPGGDNQNKGSNPARKRKSSGGVNNTQKVVVLSSSSEPSNVVTAQAYPQELVALINRELESYLRLSSADTSPMLETILRGKPPAVVAEILVREVAKTGATCSIDSILDQLPPLEVEITAKDGPFVSDQETRITRLLYGLLCKIREERKVDVSHQLMASLWKEVFTADMGGLSADVSCRIRTQLSRLFTALCRLQGDVEQCRVFVFHLLRCSDLNHPALCVAIAAVWPLVLRKASHSGPLPMVVEYIVMRVIKSESNSARILKDLERLCLWKQPAFSSSLPVHVNLQSSLDDMVSGLPLLHPSKVLEFFKSYELLLLREDWDKVVEVVNTLFLYVGRIVAKQDEDLMNMLIPSLLGMFGCVIGSAKATTKRKGPMRQIMRHVIHYLLTTKLDPRIPMGVQESAILLLLQLSPFEPQDVADRLQIWVPKHRDRISQQLCGQITTFANFYQQRCPSLQNFIIKNNL